MRKIIRVVGVAVALAISGSSSASAACYDILGCTDRDLFSRNFAYLAAPPPIGPSCDFLWEMRNGIFAEHGYCFRTARGKAIFGNEGCRYYDQQSVPLNWIEWDNVATIRRAERLKSCPR
ncbi:MAG: YARHG domain-containing protein [Hyphomicrobiaceae bacterium]